MMEHQDLLALEAAREGGKPLLDSKVEVDRAVHAGVVRVSPRYVVLRRGREHGDLP